MTALLALLYRAVQCAREMCTFPEYLLAGTAEQVHPPRPGKTFLGCSNYVHAMLMSELCRAARFACVPCSTTENGPTVRKAWLQEQVPTARPAPSRWAWTWHWQLHWWQRSASLSPTRKAELTELTVQCTTVSYSRIDFWTGTVQARVHSALVHSLTSRKVRESRDSSPES